METEQIGNHTISQMGQQREQLLNANSNIDRTMEIAMQARDVLNDMYVCTILLTIYIFTEKSHLVSWQIVFLLVQSGVEKR